MATHAVAHHYQPQVLTKTPQEITRDVLHQTRTIGSTYKLALAFFGLLLVLGIVGFAIRLTDGFDRFTPWAYFMATYAWLVTVAATAPVVAISQRLLRSHWRRPLSRISEMFAVVGVLSTLAFIPLIVLLPSSQNRISIWFEWPGTPFWTDLMAVIFLFLLGLALLWVSSIPDLAACRDHDGGLRQRLGRVTASFWRGTPRQWKVLRASLSMLGGLYFMFVVFIHTIISADFAMVLVPGWRDAILPPFHAISGLQSGLAATLVAAFVLWKWGGYRDYIHTDQFWAASKILFALSLLWMYFWFSEFVIYWYGRQPVEENILKTFMFEAYSWAFLPTILLNFVLPFSVLLWNWVRKTMLGPTLVSLGIIFGALLDQVRIFVASFNIADLRADALTELRPEPLLGPPSPLWPSAADYLIVLGGIGGLIFLFMLAMKVVPVLSIWEMNEGLLYRKTKRFLKRTIMVMGKPE